MKQIYKLFFSLAILVLFTTSGWAQALFGTLSGTVTDPSGAVVANAKITLRNADSGDTRDSVTDNQGYYSFASVPVGTYVVSVEAPGFQGFRVTGVALGGGETRSVNATLTVGNTTITVRL